MCARTVWPITHTGFCECALFHLWCAMRVIGRVFSNVFINAMSVPYRTERHFDLFAGTWQYGIQSVRLPCSPCCGLSVDPARFATVMWQIQIVCVHVYSDAHFRTLIGLVCIIPFVGSSSWATTKNTKSEYAGMMFLLWPNVFPYKLTSRWVDRTQRARMIKLRQSNSVPKSRNWFFYMARWLFEYTCLCCIRLGQFASVRQENGRKMFVSGS